MPSPHSTAPTRGVIYGRKSKDDQADSVEQQLEWAVPACARERITVAGTFRDDGISGHATSKRDDFHKMLLFCQEANRRGEPVDVLVCWQANRFSRADSQETGWYLWEFRKAGVSKMFTSQKWIDFEDMNDRVMMGIEQEVSSHQYSINLAQSSTRGKISRAKEGRWCGGKVPYGYRLRFRETTGSNGRRVPDCLVIDPETAPIVRWIFATYATGQTSLRMLAEQLNGRSEPTPSVRLGSKRRATTWNVPTIRNILTQEKYLGRQVWNKTHQGRFLGVVDLQIKAKPNRKKRLLEKNADADVIRKDDTHEALVDLETFGTCQCRLVEQRRNTTPKRGGTGLVLTGLLWCGNCNHRMVGRHKASKTAPRPIYLCGEYLSRGKSACNFNSIPESPLLKGIIRKIHQRFTPEVLDMCRAAFEAEALAGRPEVDEVPTLTRRLADLEGQVSRATRKSMTEEDETLAAEYRKEALRLIGERDRAASALASAKRANKDAPDPGAVVDVAMTLLGKLDKALERATPAEVRAILRDHLEKVELCFDHEVVGRETRCTFARGMIWLREDSPLATCLETSHGTSEQVRTEQQRTIPLAYNDIFPPIPDGTSPTVY